jgi:hypothetical protein
MNLAMPTSELVTIFLFLYSCDTGIHLGRPKVTILFQYLLDTPYRPLRCVHIDTVPHRMSFLWSIHSCRVDGGKTTGDVVGAMNVN